ncbi:MAG: GvpL/GvpF family gas vesicle protein [Desulfobaccales bacterium]
METIREESLRTDEPAVGMTAALNQKSGGEALYLFCLVPATSLPHLKDTAVEGLPNLTAERFQDITAVLSPVALEEFCGPEAEANLQDLSWLAPRLARHQEIIGGLMRRSPVLPLPFGTLFSSRDSLARCLARHRQAIRAFWEGVADREEWAVKGFLDRDRARQRLFSQARSGQGAELDALPPGARYFREQRLRSELECQIRSWLKETLGRARTLIRESVSASCPRRLLPRDITGQRQEMVANWAFLVPRAQLAAFGARLNRANRLGASYGLTFTSTGPWAPFSFAPALSRD